MSNLRYCAGQIRELPGWRLSAPFGFQDHKQDNGGNQDQDGDKLGGRHLGSRDHTPAVTPETLNGETGCAV